MNEEQEQKPVESIEEVIETLVPGLTTAEYERIRQQAIEKVKNTKHAWVMKGRGVITCTSCEYPHRSYVPMDKRLTGIDEAGNPVFT